MKERPILMSAFSVNAILGDRKSQTRRIATDDPSTKSIRWVENADTTPKGNYTGWVKECGAPLLIPIKCLYGVSGDRLWVRENWAVRDAGRKVRFDGPEKPLNRLQYPATDEAPSTDPSGKPYWWNQRPSIFMYRWASRILLEVVSVRAERVQEITPEDAIREGYPFNAPKSEDRDTYIAWFHDVWDSMHAKPKPAYARDEKGKRVIDHYVSYPWEDVQETRTHRGKPWHVIGNPWVFVVGFRSAAA